MATEVSPQAGSKTVLVTGATGYLAGWVIHDLLKIGYKVRGTVRSLANKERYEALFKLPNAKQNLTLVQANLLQSQPWNQATLNCDYVLHLATPLTSSHELNESSMIQQAVKGTRYITESSIRNHCRKLVFTSSCLTITAGAETGAVLNQEHWSDPATASNYTKSKIMAERVLWEIYQKQDFGKGYTEVTSILPSLMFGPCAVDMGFLSFSECIMAEFLNGSYPGIPFPEIEHRTCDVRDVSQALITCLTTPVDAQRIAITNQIASVSRILSTLKHTYPYLDLKTDRVGAEQLQATNNAIVTRYLHSMGKSFKIDNGRSRKVLGLEYRGLEESLREMSEYLIGKGVVKKRKKEAEGNTERML